MAVVVRRSRRDRLAMRTRTLTDGIVDWDRRRTTTGSLLEGGSARRRSAAAGADSPDFLPVDGEQFKRISKGVFLGK